MPLHRTACYCRVSTDKADQLNSLDAQKRFFQEYTARTGSSLAEIYADEGISGTKLRVRRQFLRMMQDARAGLFDLVVVKDISRFARNTVDLLQSIRELKALGINTVFLTANMTSMGDSEFIITLFGAMAQEESANTSKRIKFGKKLNAEKGRVPNLVYGYDKTPGEYFSLTVNQREAAVVQQIFAWYTQGGWGASHIARMLNTRGETTKRNCRWSQAAVSRLLHNALYTGKVINGRQEISDFLTSRRKSLPSSDWMITERPELQIIASDVFFAAQQMAAAHRQQLLCHSGAAQVHLFSALIRCSCCGHAFRRITRTYKNTYVRWVCSAHNLQGTCSNATAIDEGQLAAALQHYFEKTVESVPSLPQKLASVFLSRCPAALPDAQTAQMQAEILQLEKLRRKYMDMYADDLISRDELNQRIGGARGRLEQLRKELKAAQGAGCCPGADKKPTAFSPESLIQVEHLTHAQLQQIVDHIDADKSGQVEIYLRTFSAGTSPGVPNENIHT